MSEVESHLTHPAQVVRIGEGAARQMKQQLARSGVEDPRVRIRFVDGVAIEAQYELEIIPGHDVQPHDITIETNGVLVIVDRESATRIRGTFIEYQETLWSGGFSFDNPNTSKRPYVDPRIVEIERLIDEVITPLLAQHGGGIKLVAIEGDTAIIELRGGCQGCSKAPSTMRSEVVRTIRSKVPTIKAVRDVTDHAKGKVPYYP